MSGKAESRLIYNTISTSERVSDLGTKGALLYTWLITHCDSQGRMQGKANTIKTTVCPYIDEISIEDVDESLELMTEQKLIIRYVNEKGRQLVQVCDWWDWQTGLKHKSPSRYQAPKGWKDKEAPRDDSGRFKKEED